VNAANLCPTSLPVVKELEKNTRTYDANPSQSVRTELAHGREAARTQLAVALRVKPEEIVITRNTSEGNNMISTGLTLGPADEVLVFSDNHPSNLNAWHVKAKRFGFTVTSVAQVTPHPGTEYYVDAFRKAITSKTRVVAVTHVSSNDGSLFPVNEICALAREVGALSLVDGAQSFGVLDVDLSTMKPDFYTGSAHKWPCGPKEIGILYISQAVQDKLMPSVVSLYAGAVGASKTFEAYGQRDDAALAAFSAALKFQDDIGRDVIERRSRDLAQHLMSELKRIDGVTLYTVPERSAAIVIFKPGSLDPRKVGAALLESDRIVCTARGGADRPGLRFSPHFYNTMDEIDRSVAAIKRYTATGV
jgi:selenocysteine lyase/cysteine desulfurase